MPALTHAHRERLSRALAWSESGVLIVFADGLVQPGALLRLARGHGYTVHKGAWQHVARSLAIYDVTKYAYLLGAYDSPGDTHAAARFAEHHPHPVLLIASSAQRDELKRTNAWERRCFTLDLTKDAQDAR